MEIGDRLKLQEIEDTFSRFSVCPKCNSKEGFWLGFKDGHAYAQCKGCGTNLELFEIFPIGERTKTSRWAKFFRK
jgi:transcription elongation factor Elf1